MPQRHNLHRQIMLDADERDERILEASEQRSVEEFIAKLLRAVRRIEEKVKPQGDRAQPQSDG